MADDDYDRIIRPIERQMMSAVWRILRDTDDAADAFQQATEKIWKLRRRIRRHANPQGYVIRICVSCAYDVLRRRIRSREREDLAAAERLTDTAPSASDEMMSRETIDQVHVAIGRLSRHQAEATPEQLAAFEASRGRHG